MSRNILALLAYMDDLVLINKSHDDLEILFERLEKAAEKFGLQINKDKMIKNQKKMKKPLNKNEEFEEFFQKPNILNTIQSKKLQ